MFMLPPALFPACVPAHAAIGQRATEQRLSRATGRARRGLPYPQPIAERYLCGRVTRPHALPTKDGTSRAIVKRESTREHCQPFALFNCAAIPSPQLKNRKSTDRGMLG